MKKTIGIALAALAAATPAFAARFNATELATASVAATEAFKTQLGAEKYDAVYAIQATQSAAGGKVKVFYKVNDVQESREFFCHYHGAEIDCH